MADSHDSRDGEPAKPPPFPRIIANWQIQEKLGAGYSGAIFRARHLFTQQIAALKLQWVYHECPTNRYERGFYPPLQGGIGMPILLAAGIEGEYDYLAMELLGPSLDNLFRKSGKDCMDLRSVCCIAMQVIARLEFMHSRGILHRDIQLGNCAVGIHPNEQTIYMLDFGFSKRYIDPVTRQHIPDSKAPRDFIGNYWFSSVGVHCRGKVPSRRDDLEAVALMLIHLLTPRGLPWVRNGIPKNDTEHDRLKRQKKRILPEELCMGLPSEFEEFLRYSRRLKFKEQPDYRYWIEEFKQLAVDHGYPPSEAFIWPPPVVQQQPNRMPTISPVHPSFDEMANVLKKLGDVQIHDRPILGDRKNVANAIERAQQQVHKPPVKMGSRDVIEISDSSKDNSGAIKRHNPQEQRAGKARQLNQLQVDVSQATNNRALAQVMDKVVAVLKTSTTRTLTREGFAVLDTLYKQLADPSVFVAPMRTRSQSRDGLDQTQTRGGKLQTLARLKSQVGHADNRALAELVQEFVKVTASSSGKNITLDGFAFLEGMARRLEVLG